MVLRFVEKGAAQVTAAATEPEPEPMATMHNALGLSTPLASNTTLATAQGGNSGARASIMRGRVGVIFQGRGFESHRRRALEFYFQRKRGRVGSKIFAVVITKAALVSWQHSRL